MLEAIAKQIAVSTAIVIPLSLLVSEATGWVVDWPFVLLSNAVLALPFAFLRRDATESQNSD
jgi:hypothetical protein